MTGGFPFFPRCFAAVVLGFVFVFGCTADATAEAPMQKTQAPGYYRMMLGAV